jgi:hypothetical protein
VEDPHGATRVEIELTSNEETRQRRRKASGAAAVEFAGHDHASEIPAASPELEARLPPAEPPPALVERRTLVLVTAAVAIVSLFVGWSLGRSGGSSAGDVAQPDATVADTSPDETPPLAEIPTTVPVTTIRVAIRPRPETPSPTTAAPEWQTETVAVDPAAAALALDVVMVGGTRIAEFDTATGELRTLPLDSRVSQPQFVDAGPDWFVIRNFDSGGARLVRDREPPVDVPILDVWSSHFQPGTGTFLQAAREYTQGAPLGIVEVDHEGAETGRRFEMPGGVWPAAPDPAGGVVVSAAGGTYHVGPEGSQRLTAGNLVALSPRVALVTECGEDFSECGMYLADRATGDRTEVVPYDSASGPLAVLDVQSPAFWSSPELMGAISPDDRWAPIMLSTDGQQFGLIDLTSGELVPLGANPPSGLWWSPDAHFAIFNQSSRLMLFDTQQRTTIDIAPHGIAVDAFAVRPAVPPSDS